MEVGIYRHASRVHVDMDMISVFALRGLFDEVRSAQDPRFSSVPDVARVVADLDEAYVGAVKLDEAGVSCWLRGLLAARSYLAQSLAVADLDRREVDVFVAQLAADSPVEAAARAFLWIGTLSETLAVFA